jgi:hypothetical protein
MNQTARDGTRAIDLASLISGLRQQSFLPRHGRPDGFVVDLCVLLRIQHGCAGRGEDDALNTWCMSLDGVQDAGRALDGWVEEVLDWVLRVEVIGRCCMDHVVEGRVRLDCLEDDVSTWRGWGYRWTCAVLPHQMRLLP